MTLHYLLFDRTDDTQGWVSLEAMATVPHSVLPAVMREVDAVLAWLQAHAPGPRAPLEDGGGWDADVHTQAEGAERVCVTVTLASAEAVVDALAHHFGMD